MAGAHLTEIFEADGLQGTRSGGLCEFGCVDGLLLGAGGRNAGL